MTAHSYPQGINAPRFFQPLEATDFQRIEHAASLKGLLKPFKSKQELLTFAAECQTVRDALIQRAHRLLAQATAYPFSRQSAVLTQQTTAAGTAFLRWRNVDRSVMGVALWTALVEHPATPLQMRDELFALELERVVLNMQVSLTHYLARQARECAQKMTHAESVYRRRAPNPPES